MEHDFETWGAARLPPAIYDIVSRHTAGPMWWGFVWYGVGAPWLCWGDYHADDRDGFRYWRTSGRVRRWVRE